MKIYKILGYMCMIILVLSGCGTNDQQQQDQDDTITVIEPQQKYTKRLTKDGGYVMEINESQMLVIDASPQDFSETGGLQEFYSAIVYHLPHALDPVKVGQRVIVEVDGPIMESYPAQARPQSVEILPEYMPANADLSQSEVIEKAIEQANESENAGLLIVRDLSFDEAADVWEVSMRVENIEVPQDLRFEIIDQ